MKKISWVKLSLVLVVLAVLVLRLPSSDALADYTVTRAKFVGNLSTYGGIGGVDGVYLHSAGSISFDRSFAYITLDPDGLPQTKQATYVATLALTDGNKPLIDLMGASNSYAKVGGRGEIYYYIRADKTDPYAPDDVTVPLLVSSYGSYYVTNTNYCTVELSSYFGTPSQILQDQIVYSNSNAQGARWEGGRTIRENVPIGEIFALYLSASATVGTPGAGNSVEFQVIIDPIVKIDPEWMVLYNGNYVPGTQLYSLTFSPGFKSVPLPGVLMLLLD